MSNIIEITDFKAPELDIFARLKENQLQHYFEPAPGLFIAESPNVIERALNSGCNPYSILVEQTELAKEALTILARCGNVPVYTASGKLPFSNSTIRSSGHYPVLSSSA